MWLAAMPGWIWNTPQLSVAQTYVGLTVFMVLIGYYTASIAQRVLEGIRLQLAYETLAEQVRHALQLVEQDAATDALTGAPATAARNLSSCCLTPRCLPPEKSPNGCATPWPPHRC